MLVILFLILIFVIATYYRISFYTDNNGYLCMIYSYVREDIYGIPYHIKYNKKLFKIRKIKDYNEPPF